MQELSAQQYVQDHRPRSWSRSTVADGRWMQDKTFTPLNGNDEQLGIFIDDLVKGLNTEEEARAAADEAEAAARQQNDSDLSAWCTRLTNSAEDLYSDLADEVAARQAAIEEEQRARTQGDADTLASAKEYANNASAHALAEAKTYTDAASAYLNGRINGVSSTFNSFSSDLKTWKEGVESWEGGIDTWKTGINTWRNTEVDPKLNDLESAIAGLEGASDVYDVVGTSAALNNYVGRLTPKAVIKVLSAGPNNDQQVYYRWNHNKTASGTWTISDFDYIGGVQAYYDKGYIDSNYYKKTETYTQTEVDNYLKWKVDANTSQNFTTAQQLQARTNIGASDGSIQWVGAAGTINAPIRVFSAAGGIHIEDVQGAELPNYKFFVAPEPTTDNYGMFFGVYNGNTGPVADWLSPFPAKSSSDAGKSLVVDTDGGVAWKKVPLVIKIVTGLEYMSNDDYASMAAAIQNDEEVIIVYRGVSFHYVSASSGAYIFSAGGNGTEMILTVIISPTEVGHPLTYETRSFLPAVEQNTASGSTVVLDANKQPVWGKRVEGRYETWNGATHGITFFDRMDLVYNASIPDTFKGYIYKNGDAINQFFVRQADDIKLNGKTLKVVDALPGTFEDDTIYLV